MQHEGSVDSETEEKSESRKPKAAIPKTAQVSPSTRVGVSPVGLGNTLELVLFLFKRWNVRS